MDSEVDRQGIATLRKHIKLRKKGVAACNAALQKPKADVISLCGLIEAETAWLRYLQQQLNAKLNSTTEAAVVAKLAKRRGKKKPLSAEVQDRACSRCKHPKSTHDRHGCSHLTVNDFGFTAGCTCPEYRPED